MRAFCFAVCLLVVPTLSVAQTNYAAPMRFSAYWPCAGNSGFCAPRILAEGAIEGDTPKKFAAFLASPKLHKFALPPKVTMVFNSPGGNLGAAMELGRLIRKNKIDTVASPSYARVVDGNISQEEVFIKSPICASACIFAFAGGIARGIERESRMGIHRFSAMKGNAGDDATQITIVVLAAYLEEMGVDRALLDRASLVPATSIYWISSSESGEYRLDNTTQTLTPWKITPTNEGSAFLETQQHISPGRTVVIRIVSVKDYVAVVVGVALSKTVYRSDRLSNFPSGEKSDISFCEGTRCIRIMALDQWTVTESASQMNFHTFAKLSPKDVQMLSGARSLAISDNFGSASSDVGFATDLSTVGLKSGITLLLRIK